MSKPGNYVYTNWELDYYYFFQPSNDDKKENYIGDTSKAKIKAKYENYYNECKKLVSNKEGGTSFKEGIQNKIKECKMKEIEIAKKLKIDNELSRIKNKEEEVRFWTNYFFFRKKSKEQIKEIEDDVAILDRKFCFKIIISSEEFILALRSGRGQNALRRHNYLKSLNKEINPENLKKAQNDIINQLLSEVDDEENKIKQSVTKSFNKIIGTIDINSKNNEIEKIFEDLKNKFMETKNKGTETFFDDLKKAFRNSLSRYLEKLSNENKFNDNKLNISIDDKQPAFLTISIYQEGELQRVKRDSNNKNETFINLVMIAMENIINLLQEQNPTTLHLLGLGEIILPKDIETFFSKAKEELKNGGIKDKVKKIIGNKKIDLVSGITGVIGELIGDYNFNTLKELEYQYTGTNEDIVEANGKQINLKESYADYMSENDGGLNIKHYVSSPNSISLYKPKKSGGIPILSENMYKYIPAEQLKMLRFLEANYQYVTQKANPNTDININIKAESLANREKSISLLNIDNFLRESSTSIPLDKLPDKNNAFYQINNVIVPSSVIFTIILENIIEYKNKLITISNTNKGDKRKFEKITKPDETDIEEHKLGNLAPGTRKGTKIRFNGLTIPVRELYSMIK